MIFRLIDKKEKRNIWTHEILQNITEQFIRINGNLFLYIFIDWILNWNRYLFPTEANRDYLIQIKTVSEIVQIKELEFR